MDAGSTSQNRPQLGHPNEFADAQRQWLEARDRRRREAAAVVATDDNNEEPSAMVIESNPDEADDQQF